MMHAGLDRYEDSKLMLLYTSCSIGLAKQSQYLIFLVQWIMSGRDARRSGLVRGDRSNASVCQKNELHTDDGRLQFHRLLCPAREVGHFVRHVSRTVNVERSEAIVDEEDEPRFPPISTMRHARRR